LFEKRGQRSHVSYLRSISPTSLRAAFTDPKSVKRQPGHQCLFGLLHEKAACKMFVKFALLVVFTGKVGCRFVGETDWAQIIAPVNLDSKPMGW